MTCSVYIKKLYGISDYCERGIITPFIVQSSTPADICHQITTINSLSKRYITKRRKAKILDKLCNAKILRKLLIYLPLQNEKQQENKTPTYLQLPGAESSVTSVAITSVGTSPVDLLVSAARLWLVDCVGPGGGVSCTSPKTTRLDL